MKRLATRTGFALGLLIALAGLAEHARAQEPTTLSFSDPLRPGTLVVEVLDGDVTVRGYDGQQVVIEGLASDLSSDSVPDRAQGLQRLSGGGLTIEESDNVMRINPGWDDTSDLVIQVPYATSVRLNVLDGDIAVTDLTGEVELQATDGSLRLEGISGPILAHAVDGDIVASVGTLVGDAPTSIMTVDGDIDLTLPANSAATLTMKSLSGDIYTDFDIELTGSAEPRDEPGGFFQNRRRFTIGTTLTGAINGGGSEFQLQTVDGNIYVRRGN